MVCTLDDVLGASASLASMWFRFCRLFRFDFKEQACIYTWKRTLNSSHRSIVLKHGIIETKRDNWKLNNYLGLRE